jgi:phasin family protein
MATKVKKVEAIAGELNDTGVDSRTARLGCEELADLGRENLAAVLRANAAFSEGAEAIGKEMMGYARSSFEDAAEAATALLAARTLEDLVQLNTNFARASFERMLARSAKLSEMGARLANEALVPLGGRVEATFHKLAKPLAA